ncbi:hypothetical protein NDU88_000416 [Pleurodeles waltl]|uniref:Uncharacterized protein n=1 Tax=Pleurodeles waltl TaxID=8319 RepID=A0AAV7S5K5_PLEWA|nr:hypothetical protein NDU88_000416 [Pleurodeles waltl]
MQLVMGSLSESTRKAYGLVWDELVQSGDVRCTCRNDVVHFIMCPIDRGLSALTIAGKLSGVAFYGKLLWGYKTTLGELGIQILEGWARERGAGIQERHPIMWGILKEVIGVLPQVALQGPQGGILKCGSAATHL